MTGNSEINGNSEFFGFFGWLGSSPSLIAVSPSPLCVVPMVSALKLPTEGKTVKLSELIKRECEKEKEKERKYLPIPTNGH